MKVLFLSEEDTKKIYEDHESVCIDIYVIYWDGWGWNWAINPEDARRYNEHFDELAEIAKLNQEETEIIDEDDLDDEEEDLEQ